MTQVNTNRDSICACVEKSNASTKTKQMHTHHPTFLIALKMADTFVSTV